MSNVPVCPHCNRLLTPLLDHDKQTLALASNFPWVCPTCLVLGDGATVVPLESAQGQERAWFLERACVLRRLTTPAELQAFCEGLRAGLTPDSPVRYAWANIGPELLRELWTALDRFGGVGPDRPEALLAGKRSTKETYTQELLQALGSIVRWCEDRGKLAGPTAIGESDGVGEEDLTAAQEPLQEAIEIEAGAANDTVPMPFANLLSATELARALGANPDAVETWLRRRRETHLDCYHVNDRDDRRRNEAKYLYRVDEVWPPLLEWHQGRSSQG
jgi:hypothetical protein